MRLAFLAIALAVASAGNAKPGAQWNAEIAEAAARSGLPAAWISRVIEAESSGRAERMGVGTVSPAGAMGLMQLMPGTWRDMRSELALGDDPFDPHDNILAGSIYLRKMYDRFGYPGLFAAYNAGPKLYEEHLVTGRPLPEETRSYLLKVARGDPRGPLLHAAQKTSSLFVALGSRAPKRNAEAPVAEASLFVPLTTSQETGLGPAD